MADKIAIIKEGIDAAEKVLGLYDKVLDKCIKWDVFNETIAKLEKFKDDYSEKAGKLVGEIKTLMMDARDSYQMSVQSVFEWCSLTTKLLPIYIKLLDSKNPTDADLASQKSIILKVLGDGVEKMKKAQSVLATCSSSFNNAAGQLVTLHSQLTADFDGKSAYVQAQIDKMKTALIVAKVAAIFGVFGLIIAVTAHTTVEGDLIPQMNKKFEEIQKFYKELTDTIAKSSAEIDTTKITLVKEIAIIGELKVQTEETKFFVADDNLRSLVAGSAKKLMVQCESYMKRHRQENPTF